MGLPIYFQWLKLNSTAFAEVGMHLPENASAFGFADRLGASWIGYILIAVILFITLLWIFKVRPDIEGVGKVAIIISVLSSPFGWNMYSALLLPIFFIRKWNKALVLASVLFMIPSPILRKISEISPLFLILSGSVYFLGLILTLISILVSQRHNSNYEYPKFSL